MKLNFFFWRQSYILQILTILFIILPQVSRAWIKSWDGITYTGTQGTDFPDPLQYFTTIGFNTWTSEEMTLVNFIEGTTASVNFQGNRCETECCIADIECKKVYNKNGDNVNQPNTPAIVIFGGEKQDNSLQDKLWLYYLDSKSFSPVFTSNPGPSARRNMESVYFEKIYQNAVYSQLAGSPQKSYKRKYMYIYGGECQNSGVKCNDGNTLLWRYEIPFASQFYYPDIDQRGNMWTGYTFGANLNPGPRTQHRLIASDSKLYLFGGIDDTNSYKNDLWEFDIENETWTEITYKIFESLAQKIILWDGSIVENTLTDPNISPQEGEIIKYEDINYSGGNCIDGSDPTYLQKVFSFPQCRAGGAFIFLGNDFENIYIFGGENTNGLLEDNWYFNFASQLWTQIIPFEFDLKGYPGKKKQIQLQNIQDDNFAFIFGGTDETGLNSDFFALYKQNINEITWSQITKEVIYNSETSWPQNTNSYGLSISKGKSIISQNNIPNTTNINHITLIIGCEDQTGTCKNEIWVMSQDDCNPQNVQSNNGVCNFGYFTCNDSFYGVNCENKMCPGSICLYNSETFDPPYCISCYGQGICSNGSCSCSSTSYNNTSDETVQYYTGDDCQTIDCYKNCNQSPNKDGECIIQFPENQCRCQESNRKGGDYCEETFCLNNCSEQGDCEDGVCQCFNSDGIKYVGADCSVLEIVFLENKGNIISYISLLQLFFMFYLVFIM